MQLMNTSICALFLVTLGACNNDPVKDAPRAETAAAVQKVEEQPAAPQASVLVLPLDGKNSSLKFVGAKITDKHEGSFPELEGAIRLVEQDPTKSTVQVKIKMESLVIEPAKLAGHLRSPDFFDTEKFPEAVFESTNVEATGKDEFRVTGNLTLHGVTKAITFPARITATNEGADVEAKFGINRKDFAIVYPGMPDDLIKDEVLIDLKLSPKKS